MNSSAVSLDVPSVVQGGVFDLGRLHPELGCGVAGSPEKPPDYDGADCALSGFCSGLYRLEG